MHQLYRVPLIFQFAAIQKEGEERERAEKGESYTFLVCWKVLETL